MKFVQYREQVKALKYGKQLPTAVYLHRSVIKEVLAKPLLNLLFDNINKLNITEPWNLLKLYKRDFKVTLLNYPDFDSYAYPALHTSITIDIEEQTKRKANYQESENPPILHRKETFVLANYPLIDSFKAITAEGEAIELYKNTKTIGFKQQWQSSSNEKVTKLSTLLFQIKLSRYTLIFNHLLKQLLTSQKYSFDHWPTYQGSQGYSQQVSIGH